MSQKGDVAKDRPFEQFNGDREDRGMFVSQLCLGAGFLLRRQQDVIVHQERQSRIFILTQTCAIERNPDMF